MKQVAVRFSSAFLVLLFLTACVSTTGNTSKSVVVERRNGDITVLQNGDIQVKETWDVRFAQGSFRKAFRTIPLKSGSSVSGWQVSEGREVYRHIDTQQARTFTVSQDDDEATITWFFPRITNTKRTFTLQYTLSGALRIYPEGDQLYLKFVEADRGYTINSSRVVVHLPETFTAEQLKATTYQNRRESRTPRIIDGQTLEFSGGPFPPGTEWEIRTQFPHSIVTANAPAWQLVADQQPIYNLIALFIAAMIAIIGLSGLYLLWDMFGRDRPSGVIAQYYTAPPDATPPGMVGILIDERADLRDIIATLIDLARRGFIHIAELGGTGALAVRDISITRTDQDESTLRPYEQQLLNAVFGAYKVRYISDLRNHFHSAIPGLKQSLYEEAVRSGYFTRNPQGTRHKFAIFGSCTVILVVALGFIFYPLVAPYAPLAIWDFIAAAGVAIGLVVMSPIMPQKTLKGATTVAKWRAFKRYLEHIERYTKVADVKDKFDQYLPYAIAFGFERSFVQQFATTDTPVPDWYQPYPIFMGTTGYQHSYHDDDMAAASGLNMAMPSLDSMATNIGASLDTMSSEFFNMLDVTANALTSRVSALDSANDGKDGLFNWIGSNNDSGWSGGGDFGGGGFGGGSSGFE